MNYIVVLCLRRHFSLRRLFHAAILLMPPLRCLSHYADISLLPRRHAAYFHYDIFAIISPPRLLRAMIRHCCFSPPRHCRQADYFRHATPFLPDDFARG